MTPKKIYVCQAPDGKIPFIEFMNSLDKKARTKLEYGLSCLALFPDYWNETHTKHFSVERFQQLWEYREKIKVLIRVVFTFTDNGILLLEPFIKRHDRDTMHALEHSLILLDGADATRRLEYVPHSHAAAR